MKPLSQKKKKEKIQLHKIVSSLTTQKNSVKKVQTKKQQPPASASKSHQNNNFSRGQSAASTAVLSTAQCNTNKFIQQSLRTSPKSSLADLKSIQISPIYQFTNHFYNNSESKDKQRQKNYRQDRADPKKSKTKFAEKAKQQIKKSLANVIKVYYPQKKSFLDVSMTDMTSHQNQSTILNQNIEGSRCLKQDFNYLEIIGEGGYGKVWKVQYNKSRKQYAIKEMSKATIIYKKSVDNVLNQRKILQKISSPFIANMVGAFNDRDNLYLVMDLLSGGDLRYKMQDHEFSEQESKFLVACIIEALDYLHNQRIFHRDVKPQNLVFDDLGYLRLTDFGIARNQRDKQALDASGTPGYMAPQVICKQMHSFVVDFYAVGIIAYQMMMGKRPYFGSNRQEIREAILSKQHSVKRSQVPNRWSLESGDFINKLIQRQPGSRLGFQQGVKELKEHAWFRRYPWSQIKTKSLISPFKRKAGNLNFKLSDESQLMMNLNGQNQQAVMRYKLLQRAQDKLLDAFSGYNHRFKDACLA